MAPHEYNPIHTHQGSLFTGLSSVMMLKIPEDMGPEIVRDEQPSRGNVVLYKLPIYHPFYPHEVILYNKE